MIKETFFLILFFSILIFEVKPNNKNILHSRKMDNEISFDSSAIHKIWELDGIKPLSKGMGGMDDGFKILDFRDPNELFLIGQNNIPVSALYYRINGNILIISSKENVESEIESDVIWKITNLTHDKLVITLTMINKNNNQVSYRDFVELTYKVKN